MDNLGVARILRAIADLLEIKNDNPFKIRAYRNGAGIVANHPHTVASLDAPGLREIPGIGKDLAARIREIADTGGAEFHRELVAEFPPSVLDLLHLQGVGRGAPVVISSDAHSRRGFGVLRWDVLVARRAWLTTADVLNTRPFEPFKAGLRRYSRHGARA